MCVLQNGRSRTLLLSELGKELGDMRDSLNKRLQGKITNLFHKIYDGGERAIFVCLLGCSVVLSFIKTIQWKPV